MEVESRTMALRKHTYIRETHTDVRGEKSRLLDPGRNELAPRTSSLNVIDGCQPACSSVTRSSD